MKGGGVALFFNNDMHVSWKVRPDLSIRDSREMESLFVQINPFLAMFQKWNICFTYLFFDA